MFSRLEHDLKSSGSLKEKVIKKGLQLLGNRGILAICISYGIESFKER
jgi:hypothetical protein